MTTAVEAPQTPSSGTSGTSALITTSLIGSIIVLVSLAVSAVLIPQLWHNSVTPKATSGLLLLGAQLVALVGIILVGMRIVVANPPRGFRGGVLLITSIVLTIFFLSRAIGMWTDGGPLNLPLTLVTLIGLSVLAFIYLKSAKAQDKMVSLESQGWLHFHSYKATQGLRVRRWTMIGILLVGWSGAYSLYSHESFGTGNYALKMPFNLPEIPFLQIAYLTGPLLLALLVLWFAWRLVNVPTFADFLIATEAEMNKVSWSTRRRLVQDTIVVFVTLFILTTFLFVVDYFWGSLLSLKYIDVLPQQKENQQQKTLNPGY